MFVYECQNQKKKSKLTFPFAGPRDVAYYSHLYGCLSTRKDLEEYQDLCHRVVPFERKRNGRLSVETFQRIVRWKSPRSIGHALKNDPKTVHEITGMVCHARTERGRIAPLLGLDGIQLPQASALIHLMYPDVYPIIDRRAVAALGRSRPPDGYGLFFWDDYKAACAQAAGHYGVSMRELDRALWAYSKQHDRTARQQDEGAMTVRGGSMLRRPSAGRRPEAGTCPR